MSYPPGQPQRPPQLPQQLWTDDWQPGQPYAPQQPPYGQQPPPPLQRKRRRRVFPWVFLAIQVLFVIWVIAGAASGHSAAVNCHDQYLTHQECANATEAGAAIGVGLVVVLWAVVDIILGISYGVWRLARR